MRTRKNPGPRQEAFLKAATALFLEKGFDGVSVRDILDTVDDKSSSPSVLYYYFPSKEDLYRSCLERAIRDYITSLEEALTTEVRSEEERVILLISCIDRYILKGKKLMSPGSTSGHRLFVLDMRDRVKTRIADLWKKALTERFGFEEDEARIKGIFLSGGIGELVMFYLTDAVETGKTLDEFLESAIRLSCSAISIGKERTERFVEAMKRFRSEKKEDIDPA